MSNDNGKQTCKSVLSPHVAEFVPQSAVTKKITQDDNKIQPEVPVPEEMPASTREDTFQKIRVGGGESQERQAKKVRHFDHYNGSSKVFSQSIKDEEWPSSSWRRQHREEHKLSRYPRRQKGCFGDADKNWRENENFVNHDVADKTNLNLQTTIKSKLDEISTGAHRSQQKGIQRGFGRGRGRARSAWTEDQVDKGKDFKILRSYDSVAGTHSHGRGMSYSNKFKGTDDQVRVDFLSHRRKEFEVTKGENQENREKGDDGWIRIRKKKTPNHDQKEYEGMKHKESSSGINNENKDRNAFENQQKEWKDRRESVVKTSVKTEGNISNDTIDPERKGTSLKQYERDLAQLKKIDPSNKSKQRGLIKKQDGISTENITFDILDNEFPDLQSTNTKSGDDSLASDWLSGGSRMPIISYSAALKTIPIKPQPRPSNKCTKMGSDNLQSAAKDGEMQTKKKKKKKRAKDKNKNPDCDKSEQSSHQSVKKTKQPMQLDLGDWLSSLEKAPTKNKADKQVSKKVTIATGVLQIKLQDTPDPTTRTTGAAQPSNTKTTLSKKTHGFHNILDSTAPVVKRGKERETPKKKKPSPLKRIILKEREEKKKATECGNQDTKIAQITENKSEEAIEVLTQEETPSLIESEKCYQKDDITTCSSNGAINTCKEEDALVTIPTEDDVKAQIHSRRFREYCDNVMDKELNKTTIELLQKLVIFQDRQYHKDPVKSKAKRRYVVGLREVTKHLKLKKIKLVIISPNVERIKSAGGLDDTLHNIITIAHQNGVPVVFALRRQILGRILFKKVPVSAIGVFNYDGAQDQFKELMDLTEKARAIYADRWKKAYDELMEIIQKEKVSCDEQSEEQIEGECLNLDKEGLQEDDPNSGSDDEESKKEAMVEKRNRPTENHKESDDKYQTIDIQDL